MKVSRSYRERIVNGFAESYLSAIVRGPDLEELEPAVRFRELLRQASPSPAEVRALVRQLRASAGGTARQELQHLAEHWARELGVEIDS